MTFSPTRLRPRFDGETIPPDLILISDGSSPPPAGWSVLSPAVVGSYLALGNDAGHGGAATHGHAATAAHAHADGPHHAHRFELGAGDVVEEEILIGDASRAFGVPHTHSSNEFSDEAAGATRHAATTTLESVANELSHREVLLVKNTGGARSTRGLMCLALDRPADDGWRGIGEPDGPAASFAGRFLKLVDADPEATPSDAAAHVHAIVAHHETHATFDHGHGPASSRDLTFQAVDPTDTATDAAATSGPQHVPAQAHFHTATLPPGSIDSASPAVTTTVGEVDAVDAAATLDRFVVDLFKAARNAGLVAGVCGLWDSHDGSPPEGWEPIDVAATHNAPYVRVRGDEPSTGELQRAGSPNGFSVEHRHALDEHGHATSVVSSVALGEGSLTDRAAEGSEAAASLAPALSPVAAAVDDAELAHAESSWSVTPQADAHLPLFERFVLIRKT